MKKKISKTKDGKIMVGNKIKTKDRKAIQWEINKGTIKHWEKEEE